MNTDSSTQTARLVIATHNAHKTEEFRVLLGGGWQVEDLRGCAHLTPPEEAGETFEENAIIKAMVASASLGPEVLVVADDSGLEVDALDGRPGIYSARYAGPGAGDGGNLEKVLSELAAAGVRGKDRSARFRCVLAAVRGGRVLATVSGAVDGIMANEAKGSGGFGYDPAFIPAGYCETFGQLPAAVKNELSHRAKALASLKGFLDEWIKAAP